jgi:hypothetical protein
VTGLATGLYCVGLDGVRLFCGGAYVHVGCTRYAQAVQPMQNVRNQCRPHSEGRFLLVPSTLIARIAPDILLG